MTTKRAIVLLFHVSGTIWMVTAGAAAAIHPLLAIPPYIAGFVVLWYGWWLRDKL